MICGQWNSSFYLTWSWSNHIGWSNWQGLETNNSSKPKLWEPDPLKWQNHVSEVSVVRATHCSKVEQELPSYISTNARLAASSCHLRLPALEWLSHLASSFIFYFPTHPTPLFVRPDSLHSPVASSYMYPALVLACACPSGMQKSNRAEALALCPGVHSANCRSRQRSWFWSHKLHIFILQWKLNFQDCKDLFEMITDKSIMSFPFWKALL